jgi:iron complex outermembrane recepter protein
LKRAREKALRNLGELLTGGVLVALVVGVAPAQAQRTTENAVTDADDAFGTNVGLETTGIYTENDTRGFSPLKAGNSRIDGVYYDPVAVLSGRLRQGTSIRVGFAAEDYPFQAPTGIVDNRFKPWPTELGASVGLTRYAYGGHILDLDLRVPLIEDHLGLTGGVAKADTRLTSGQRSQSWGVTVRPILRLAGFEVAPFVAMATFTSSLPQPLVVVSDLVPDLPPKRRYLGQTWAEGKSEGNTYGVHVKGAITDKLSLRGGLFRSETLREKNFSEIYQVLPGSQQPSGGQVLANHLFISDPVQDIRSDSGEVQLAWRFGTDRWRHRIFAGYRARDRRTDSNGSWRRNFGEVVFGEPDPQPEQEHPFGEVNEGRVRQSSFMLGYIGKHRSGAVINLGLQRARYRADFFDAARDLTTSTRTQTWLYNATVGVPLTQAISVYVGTQRGLEDSGAVPESAINRNEQLPATITTQYEGGVRWKFDGGQLVVNAFQITKAYFASVNGFYVDAGDVRHRGIEASLSGRFFDHLTLLAGAVIMQPRVLGAAVEAGQLGQRPVGTPSLYARIDANYRTDIFGGLTPTVSVIYTGSRAVGSRPLANGSQLTLPGVATVDLGVRQQFKLGEIGASFRIVVQNVFDTAAWKVVGDNTLTIDERRRVIATLAADF